MNTQGVFVLRIKKAYFPLKHLLPQVLPRQSMLCMYVCLDPKRNDWLTGVGGQHRGQTFSCAYHLVWALNCQWVQGGKMLVERHCILITLLVSLVNLYFEKTQFLLFSHISQRRETKRKGGKKERKKKTERWWDVIGIQSIQGEWGCCWRFCLFFFFFFLMWWRIVFIL